MSKIFAVALAVAGLGFSGCAARYADVPAPTRFENSDQKKLQAASHWQTIADHVASQIGKDVSSRLQGRAVFVPQPSDEQKFVTGFRDLLITALVQRGIPVSTQPTNALTVDVRYSIYKFAQNRAKNTRYYGEATALAAGVWAVGGVLTANISSASGVDAGAKLLATAAGFDGFGWLKDEYFGQGKYASGEVPRSEIILTTSISDAGRIISRSSNIYYSADEDKELYWEKPGSGLLLKVEYQGEK